MKQPYISKDGTIVPGVTTICNMLDKPQLLDWVAKVTKEGKDWREERDSAGDAGTLAHAMIMSYWTKGNVDIKGYSFEEIGQAYFCYNKFLLWPELPDIEPILIEQPMLSEVLGVGGTPDIYARIRSTGKKRRIDAKTASGIYDSAWYQLGGYDIIGQENGQDTDEHQILWIPKDDRFDAPIRKELKREKEIFKHLLAIYQLRKED